MDKFNEALKLMKCFPCSFMNYEGEIIFDKKAIYFLGFQVAKLNWKLNVK